MTNPTLATHVDGLFDKLRTNVRSAIAGHDVEAVHDARVATRRIKAAIDLLKPILPKSRRKELSRSTRTLRRRLGDLRDLDVMIGYIEPMAAHAPNAPVPQWLLASLQKQRKKALKDCRQSHLRSMELQAMAAWTDTLDDVKDLQRDGRRLLIGELPRQLRAFADQADAYVAHTRAPARSAAAARAHDPHALRIAGKIVRYTLELGEAAGIAVPRTVLRKFKRLQDALGLWHDYVVLAEQVLAAAIDEDLAIHNAELYTKAVAFSMKMWRRSRQHLQRFVTLWQQLGPKILQDTRNAIKAQASSAA